VHINSEDFPTSVQNPRILAAGGDLTRVNFCPDPNAGNTDFYLPDDIDVLREFAKTKDVGLIIIDPLAAHLNLKFKTENDQHMKFVLYQLAKLAQDLNAPILAVRHLKKQNTGTAITSGMGSMGIVGSARAAFIVGPNPDNSEEKVLACSKMNYASKPPSNRFKIVSHTVQAPDGTAIETSTIEWLGETDITADDLCKPDQGKDGSVLKEAIEFLQDILAEGSLPFSTIFAEAKEAGISKPTLYRAKKTSGVKSKKDGDSWAWQLPKPKE